jgi:hypothetical protein
MMSYRVTFVYETAGMLADAEVTIAELLDAFTGKLLTDRTVGGTLEEVHIDATLADTPRYADVAGIEYREYPVLITGVQRNTYPVTH